MKKLIPVLALLCTAASLFAQVVVTSATFPAVGDTLKIRTNFIPDNIEVGPAGGNQTWDFTSLGGNLTNETVYLDASAGSVADQLPNATHVVINATTGAESYYQITSTQVRFLGAFGDDPAGFGIEALFRFTPPIQERRAPLEFPSVSSTTANLLIGFAWDDLPPILTDSLDLPLAPDSIRVRIVQERDDFVDAWGTMKIPGGEYEVLREKRSQYTETRVDAKVPFFGWQDVTELLLMGGFAGLGTDTTITYNYFSNEAKEPIAIARMDSTGMNVNRVDYKNNGFVSPTVDVLNEGPTVQVMPNPVVGEVRFGLHDFPQGEVSAMIFSATGKLVVHRKIQVGSNGQAEAFDLSHCPAGNFFYQFIDGQGHLIATGKLVKI